MDKLSLYLTDSAYNSNWAVRNSQVPRMQLTSLDMGT